MTLLEEAWKGERRGAPADHHNKRKQARSPCIPAAVSIVCSVWLRRTAFLARLPTGAHLPMDQALLISPTPMPKHRHASVPAYHLKTRSETTWILVWRCQCEMPVLQNQTNPSTRTIINHSWDPETVCLASNLCLRREVLLKRARRNYCLTS